MNRVINPTPLGGGGGGLVPTIRATAPIGSSVTCDGQTKVVGAEGFVDFVVSAEPVNILPDGVQGLTHIGSSKTQYIKTGINATTNLVQEYDVKYPSGNGYINGCIAKSDRVSSYYGWGYGFASEHGQGIEFSTSEAKIDTWHHIIEANAYVTVDTLTKTRPSTTFSLGEIWLFRRNDSTTYDSSIEMGEYLMYDGAEQRRRFVPAIYNSQVGMWDTVSNSFFGNQGTGSFIAGEPKEWTEYPTYIVTVNGTSKSVMVDKTALFSVNF